MNKHEAELIAALAASYAPARAYVIEHRSDVVRDAVRDAKAIIRNARKLRFWSEAACNGINRYDAKLGRVMASWTEADDAKAEKETDKARAAIHAVLRNYRVGHLCDDSGKRVRVKFQNDPRGWVVSIAVEASRTAWGM